MDSGPAVQGGSMQLLSARQQQILELARANGRVHVDELAIRFDVTTQTIRKDINDLCDRRMMTRVHGGAVVAPSPGPFADDARRPDGQGERRRLAEAVARLVPDGSSLFIGSGAVAEEIARALVDHEGLAIVTSNVHVAAGLCGHAGTEVTIVAGQVRARDGGVTGPAAAESLRRFRPGIAILEVSGLADDGAILGHDLAEAELLQGAIGQSRRIVLVAPSSAFASAAAVCVADLSQADMIVVDQVPSADFRALCQRAGTSLVEVSAGEAGAHEPGVGAAAD
ncbi:DeoR family transcriptional regulator [Allostella vacuolata]|nr:DeoR family transcriptional regulator [Stella vacuolata]